MSHAHIVVVAQGECCKTYGFYPRRKGGGGILILVRSYVGSYQTLRLSRTIIITNIQMNKE